jgi:isopentenyl diphosphate isomerase/L-lactate dehydrogenase-like FMN-dependent dehydrogenase
MNKGTQMKPINLNDYETIAQTCIEPPAWDYIQGGSDDEVTLRANRSAFEGMRLRPRMLVNGSSCDLRTTVLGTPVSMPILVAPAAYQCLAHPEGECATAQGAGMANTLMAASTFSTRSLEDIAQAASGPLWFQLYLYQNLELSAAVVRRAEAAGYRAIVLTADVPRLGRREKDIRNNFSLPSHMGLANFPDEEPESEQYSLFLPCTPSWDTLDWLKTVTSLPILVKGILTAEDALLALERGAAGIIVSNHGGRQLDSAIASIEALPEIVEAVAGRCEIYLDSGIRRGTDVLKALALGARAVLLGRPIFWGLAVNGAEGVHHVLELLRAELEQAMVLSGHYSLETIDRSLVKFV